MIIKVTGDTHGDKFRLLEYNRIHKENKDFDVLLICGDFGFLWNNSQQEKDFLDRIEKDFNFEIWFVDGNHENFPLIYSFPVEEWNGGKIHRVRNNIIHLMRGEVYTINGKKIFTMGGAYSIDKAWRIEGKSWWKEEFPSQEEIDNAITNLINEKFNVDYVFTHTAPNTIIPFVSEFFISSDKAIYDESTNFLEAIYKNLNFKHWYFGHFHGNKSIDDKFTILYETSRDIEI